MLRAFPRNSRSTRFCMASLVGCQIIAGLMTLCIAIPLNLSIKFEEHIQQKTGFSSSGKGPGLVSTRPERSDNLEISQKTVKMVIGTNFWKGERKMGAECGCWIVSYTPA